MYCCTTHGTVPSRVTISLAQGGDWLNCLTSLWDKLNENPMRTQTQLISDPKDLLDF